MKPQPSRFGPCFRKYFSCDLSSPGPALAPRQFPILFSNALVKNLQPISRDVVERPSRQSESVGDASINPYCGLDVRRVGMFHFCNEDNVPTQGIQYHCNVLDFSRDGSRQPEFDLANFGDVNNSPFGVQLEPSGSQKRKAEAVIDSPFSWRRISSTARKVISISLVQVLQSILQAINRGSRNPFRLSTQCSQLSVLREVGDVGSYGVLVVPPPVPPLLQSQIVNETTNSGEFREQIRLMICWVKPKFVASVDFHLLAFAMLINDASDKVRNGYSKPLGLLLEVVFLGFCERDHAFVHSHK